LLCNTQVKHPDGDRSHIITCDIGQKNPHQEDPGKHQFEAQW